MFLRVQIWCEFLNSAQHKNKPGLNTFRVQIPSVLAKSPLNKTSPDQKNKARLYQRSEAQIKLLQF